MDFTRGWSCDEVGLILKTSPNYDIKTFHTLICVCYFWLLMFGIYTYLGSWHTKSHYYFARNMPTKQQKVYTGSTHFLPTKKGM